MMRLPKATFFLSSSSSLLLLATFGPLSILRTKALNSPLFGDGCGVSIFSPLNVHPIPLLRIGSHGSFQPLRHTQRVFAYCSFVSIGSDQIKFRLDDHLQSGTLIMDQVDRHNRSAGPQGQGRWSPASQHGAAKKRHMNSIVPTVFISNHDGEFVASQYLNKLAPGLLTRPGMNRFLPDLQAIVVHESGKLPISRLIDQNVSRVIFNGQSRPRKKKVPQMRAQHDNTLSFCQS